MCLSCCSAITLHLTAMEGGLQSLITLNFLRATYMQLSHRPPGNIAKTFAFPWGFAGKFWWWCIRICEKICLLLWSCLFCIINRSRFSNARRRGTMMRDRKDFDVDWHHFSRLGPLYQSKDGQWASHNGFSMLLACSANVPSRFFILWVCACGLNTKINSFPIRLLQTAVNL